MNEKSKLKVWAEDTSTLKYMSSDGTEKSAGCNFQRMKDREEGALWLLTWIEELVLYETIPEGSNELDYIMQKARELCGK